MHLWLQWWSMVRQLEGGFSRRRTFLWFAVCLAGMTVRRDLLGVTSIVRALGLKVVCYDRILDFFHSDGFKLETLTQKWAELVIKLCPGVLRVNGRLLLVGDGLKAPKSGKKMPGVKLLHQGSESNTKPTYIMGHSCQAVGVLAGALRSVFAIPLASRIHEGVVFSNRDKRTLLDKMVLLLFSLGISEPFYFIADAYYASGSVVKALLAKGNHLITRVRHNAVAYHPHQPCSGPTKRGRPRKYGNKVLLRHLLDEPNSMETADSPVYNETDVQIRYRCIDLLWRPVGALVRFVAVIHPHRGACLFMTTDLTLAPLEVIRLYGLRFKIETSFKQAIHTLGVYVYHFWMMSMTPLRRGSGNQCLHRKTEPYRNAVRRKIDAYNKHIQTGLIAQGLLQYLACAFPSLVFSCFGSWIRTIRPGLCPSEQVTSIAMQNTLTYFLAAPHHDTILQKFLIDNTDLSRYEGSRLVA